MELLTQRTTICETCGALADADLIVSSSAVEYHKFCQACQPNGAVSSVVQLADDPHYFRQAYSLGLQLKPRGIRAIVIELTEDCNLACPICIAGSAPGKGNYKSLQEVKSLISIAESHGPDVLMLSGGEPTIHPEFKNIVLAALESSIRRVMVISNGKRFADDQSLSMWLGERRSRLEIYLQFDSLDRRVLEALRGEDLLHVRTTALRNLGDAGVDVSLVCVVQRDLNEQMLAQTLDLALCGKTVRGITFQPLKVAGKAAALKGLPATLTLTELRRLILTQVPSLDSQSIVPHPLSPEGIAIGYLQRSGGTFNVVTDLVMGEVSSNWRSARESLFLLPDDLPPEVGYSDIFRVAIVAYMDSASFSTAVLPQSLIGFVGLDGKCVSLEQHYILGA